MLFWCAAHGSVSRLVQFYFTSTDTVRTVRHGTPCTLRPRRPYGLLRTGRPVLYAHGDRTDCKGRDALYFTSTDTVRTIKDGTPCTLRPRTPYGLLRTGRPVLYVHGHRTDCKGRGALYFTSTDTVRTVRDGVPCTSTSSFTQLRSSVLQCCFTSTETVQTTRDGEPGRPSRLSHSS